MKTAERLQARDLRAKGWSVREIEQHLGVARSSVSRWVRDVELGETERRRLVARAGLGPIVSGERKARRARTTRTAYQDEGRRLARERDATYAAGCMLYWAEGAKHRNMVRLTNSDPELVVAFMSFLRTHFGVSPTDVRIHCNLFADHRARQDEIERYWLERLDLPPTALRRSTVNVHSKYSKKKRTNKLPYGTCALYVHSTRIVQTIYGSIQEYGGFQRPEWLD